MVFAGFLGWLERTLAFRMTFLKKDGFVGSRVELTSSRRIP